MLANSIFEIPLTRTPIVFELFCFKCLALLFGTKPNRATTASIFLLASGLSLLFEVTQYIFAIGASDITDAIDNTLGAVIGILLYLGMKKIWKEKTGKIITILGAVLEVLFLALLFFTFAANGMF